MSNYKIQLGINFTGDKELNNIKKQLTNLTDNTHRVRIDIDNSRLLKQIEHAKKELKELSSAKGNQPSLTVNSKALEDSLGRLEKLIEGIKLSLGSLDNNVNTKDLVSSINQMATALGKAESESDSLVKSLSALSKKDFNFNFNFKAGNQNPAQLMTKYGQEVVRTAIPALEKQILYLENTINQKSKSAIQNYFLKKYQDFGGKTFASNLRNESLFGVDSDNKKLTGNKQMLSAEKYIRELKEVASLNNIDLSGFNNEFSKTATEVINDTTKIQSGVKDMEEQVEKFKSIFGGIDAKGLKEVLSPIIDDVRKLGEFIDKLAKNNSIDNLTGSFNRLAGALEPLTKNLNLAKDILNTGFSDSTQKINQQIGKTITKSAKQSINLDDVIDKEVLKLMNEYAIAGNKSSKAFDEIKQSLVDFRNGSGDVNKVTSAISNNMKVVNEAKNDYKQLAEHIKMFNASGAKIHIPDSIKQEYGDDYETMRKQLGSGRLGNAFTSGKGMDFETFVEETNELLGQTIDLSHGAEAAFGDLVNKINSTKGSKFLTGDDLFRNGILDMGDVIANVSTSLEQIENAEEEIVQTSTNATNTISQNEEKKQQAYQETAKVVSSIQKGKFQKVFAPVDEEFGGTKNTAKSVEQYFRNLEGVISDTVSVQERFDTDGSLNGFTVSLKNVNGEAERLRYTFQAATEESKEFFRYTGGSINDNAVGKQIEKSAKKANELQIDLDRLKTKYSDMGAPKPIKEEAHIESLQTQYEKVQAAIENVRSADNTTYNSMVANVEKEKAALESLVQIYRNAETFSTDLRAKDRDTAKEVYSSRLDVLSSKMRKDGVYEGLETDVTNLSTKISGASDVKALSEIANELTKLDAKYKSAKAAKDEFNRSQNVGSSVLGLKSDIEILQKASPSIKGFKTEINGAEVSIESLLKDLDQVGTKSDFDVVEGKVEAFGKAAEAAGIDLNETKTEIKKVNDVYKQMLETQKQIRSLSIKEKNLTELGNINELNEVSAKLKNLKSDYEALKRIFGEKLTTTQFGNLQAEIDQTESELKQLDAKFTDIKVKLAQEIKFKLSDTGFNGFEQEVVRAHADAEKLEGAYNNLDVALDKLDTAMADVYSADQAGDVKKLVAANEEYESSLKQVYSQLKLYQQAEEKAYKNELLSQKKASLNNDMEIWLKDNTRAAKDFGEEIRKLQASLDGLDDKGVKLVGQQFKNITKQAQAMGKTGLTVFDKLKSKAKEYMTYLSAAELFMYAEQAFRSMFEQVKLIDSAMTELKKVTDETDAAYEKFLTNAASKSKEIGTTIDGLVSSTADFARLGYGFEDSQGLAEVANIYAVVGDEIEGVEGATESLISTMAAFKGEMNGMSNSDFAMRIIDVYNELGNKFAISSGGLGEALERSASSLAAANNSLYESAALITAANTVVQDPEAVGTAFKTKF